MNKSSYKEYIKMLLSSAKKNPIDPVEVAKHVNSLSDADKKEYMQDPIIQECVELVDNYGRDEENK